MGWGRESVFMAGARFGWRKGGVEQGELMVFLGACEDPVVRVFLEPRADLGGVFGRVSVGWGHDDKRV